MCFCDNLPDVAVVVVGGAAKAIYNIYEIMHPFRNKFFLRSVGSHSLFMVIAIVNIVPSYEFILLIVPEPGGFYLLF